MNKPRSTQICNFKT